MTRIRSNTYASIFTINVYTFFTMFTLKRFKYYVIISQNITNKISFELNILTKPILIDIFLLKTCKAWQTVTNIVNTISTIQTTSCGTIIWRYRNFTSITSPINRTNTLIKQYILSIIIQLSEKKKYYKATAVNTLSLDSFNSSSYAT